MTHLKKIRAMTYWRIFLNLEYVPEKYMEFLEMFEALYEVKKSCFGYSQVDYPQDQVQRFHHQQGPCFH